MSVPRKAGGRAEELVPADELRALGSDPNVERMLLRAMLNVVPDYLFVKDKQSRFILCNPAVAEDIGLSVADLLGKTDFDLHPAELAQKFFDDEQSVIRTGEARIDIEEFVVSPTGKKTYLLTSKLPLHNTKGEVIGIVGVSRNVTYRHEAEQALAESESRWNFALESAGQGVWDINLRQRTAFFSRIWRQARGLGPDDRVDPTRAGFLARIHPDDRARIDAANNMEVTEARSASYFEFRERHRDGHYIWFLSRGKPVEWNPDGSVARIIGTDTDITALKEAEARRAAETTETYRRHLAALEKAHDATEAARQMAQSMARHDALTGLPNRRVFAEALETAVARAQRADQPCAVLIIDLDHFKPVNDLYGHAAGDYVLTEISTRLSDLTRKGDVVARLGGDEFGAIINGSPLEDAAAFAAAYSERLIATASQPIAFGDRVLNVGATVGIALCPADGTEPDMLMRAADMAMYQAKEEGRGTFRLFQPTMESALRDRVALEEEVRKAVANEEIKPFYQPLVKLSEDRLVGFELLARWHHPTRGEIEPDTFIPIVEKLGLIGNLTYSLLRRACMDARTWPEELSLAINISPTHFNDPLLPVKILAILSEVSFPPSRLEVEVTETALVTDIGAARTILATLQSLGIKISLDDFGVGYSSLYNLRELRFDKIKIDRSFVQSMLSNTGSAKIVHSVIELAKSLGLPTIAEGIEHQDALKQIVLSGGEYGQGFYFGKAMPAEQVRALIAEKAGGKPMRKSA